MAEHSFSGPKKSIGTTTWVCPVVLDTIFNHFVVTVEHVPACVVVMSDSSSVPSILWALVQLADPVQTSYDLDLPIYLNGELKCR